MIEILNDVPRNVIGFRAAGKVTKDDYEKVLLPAVDSFSKNNKKINFLLLLDTDVSNYSFGAWVDDILLGLKHFSHWHKVAIVSHSNAIKKITDIFGHLVPGEYKGFITEDLGNAINWLAS